MKKWHKRTLGILALGIAGTVALAYRPVFCRDSAAAPLCRAMADTPLTEYDGKNGIRFEYRWNLNTHPKGTLLAGDLAPDAFSLLQPEEWHIRVHTENGQLKAEFNTPTLRARDNTQLVKTEYHAYFAPPVTQYTPGGKLAAEHRLHLICRVNITPPLWQKPICTTASQVLSINPTHGSADLMPPALHTHYGHQARKIIRDAPEPPLPARFCGTQREQVLQFLLYEFADAALSADTPRLRRLYPLAEQYTNELTTPDKEWPACWEEAAAEAERGARLIEQTLTILQENNCFDSQELADFINGPVFARIFGSELKKREKIDFGAEFERSHGGIEFEIITEEEAASWDDDEQKN